jgi:sterol desaturase/sphingolipid hydroxylase (fatty acid hydroxylase superfamily)
VKSCFADSARFLLVEWENCSGWEARMADLLESLGARWLTALWWLLPYGVIFTILERLLGKAEPEQRIFRKGFTGDLLHSFINPVLAAPIVAVAFAAFQTLVGGLNESTAPWVSSFPFWAQVLAAILAGDIIGYWRHRLLHMKYGWPFHAVHHSSDELDWLSNDRVDVGENLVTAVLAAAGLFCLGFSTEVAIIQIYARRTYGIFLHCNITWSYGWLDWIFVSPRCHRWHHSADPRAIDKNFATFFSFLDLLFGTYFMPRGELPQQLGLIREKMPDGYVAQVTYPYRALWRMLWNRGAGVRSQTTEVRSQGSGTTPPIQSGLRRLPHEDPAGVTL